jgi:hypothetical protein
MKNTIQADNLKHKIKPSANLVITESLFNLHKTGRETLTARDS